MQQFLKNLKNDKIKINWNKKPIPMEKFLSFLTVETTRSTQHLGSDTGWTRLIGDNNLEIGGGYVTFKDENALHGLKKVEFLDTIKYKKNLDNPYNDFVNPFYLFEIMTQDGKDFFLDYYKEEINIELEKAKSERKKLEKKLEDAKKLEQDMKDFWANIC